MNIEYVEDFPLNEELPYKEVKDEFDSQDVSSDWIDNTSDDFDISQYMKDGLTTLDF